MQNTNDEIKKIEVQMFYFVRIREVPCLQKKIMVQ